MPRGNVRVSISADSSGVARETKAAERHLDRFSKSGAKGMKNLGGAAGVLDSRFGKLAKAASAVGVAYVAIAEGKDAINVTTDLAKATLSLNKSFGLTVGTASEFAAVARARGAETKPLIMGFKALATAVRNAGTGAESALAPFKELGISQRELAATAGDSDKLLRLVSDGLGKLPPGYNKAALSAKLFGRSWVSLSPIIRDGSKEMDKQLALAQKYGASFSGGTLKSMEDFIKAQREARLATLGLQVSFGTKLAPALTKIIPAVAGFVNEMRTGKGEGGKFADAMVKIGRVLALVFKGLHELGVSFRHFARVIADVGVAVAGFGDQVRRNLINIWRAVEKAFGDAMAAVLRGFAKLFDAASHLPFIGDKFDGLAKKTRKWAADVDRLGESLDGLPSRKHVDVRVSMSLKSLDGSNIAIPPGPHGDGWGIEKTARRIVQGGVASGSINPFGPVSGFLGTSEGLMGANQNLGPFASLGNRMGLHVTSGFRPGSITSSGNLSYHAMHRAIDMADGPVAMLKYAKAMAAMFGSRLKELIHSPLGFSIKNGQQVAPYAVADHYDHVHVAMAKGGQTKQAVRALVGEKGPEVVDLPANSIVHPASVSRKLKTGDGWGRATTAARAAGFHGNALKIALAVAAAESGNFTDFIGDGGNSFSPWQIYLPAHPQYSRSKLLSNWTYAAKAAYQISSGGSNWSPWTMFRNGGYQQYLDEAEVAIAGHHSAPGRHRARHPKRRHARRPGGRTPVDRMSGSDIRGAFMGAFSDQLAAGSALAALTDDKNVDDIAVANKAITGWQAFLDLAKSKGDQAGITEAATQLKQWQDTLTDLTSATEEQNTLLQQRIASEQAHTAALNEHNAILKTNQQFAQTQGSALMAAFLQFINGGIGGNAGLGRQFPSSTGLGGLARA